MVHFAKGVFRRLLPDVRILTDCHSSLTKIGEFQKGCGPSPGLHVCLNAIRTTGIVIAAETCLNPCKRQQQLHEGVV